MLPNWALRFVCEHVNVIQPRSAIDHRFHLWVSTTIRRDTHHDVSERPRKRGERRGGVV